ncbi:MAG: DUF3126 family protein [Alphaproteobacteria bacterium]|uniref:DUF3126 domain-containing protein n=1 Tax=hydrothermal vent metagenome TaxID=652676 RepID=A0A3B0RRL0_9ZZZZ|nr:DUF3126 family protein [Alphaproteobacteria bacterium]
MNRTEIMRLRKYLNDKFETGKFELEPGNQKDGSMELHFGGEFIGVIYRDEDEGEVSYALNIAILEEDLPTASDASLI